MQVVIRFTYLAAFFLFCHTLHAQTLRGFKWAKDGTSYYTIEQNEIVQYKLPSFQRVVVADSQALVANDNNNVLAVRDFSFSDDGKKLLIYTNTKKVWRQDTRGDYWILDVAAHTLRQ